MERGNENDEKPTPNTEQDTQVLAGVTPSNGGSRSGDVPWRKIALGAGAVVLLGAAAYAVDWVSSSERVPRGVSVAGVQVGGKSFDDAESQLRSTLGPRADQPVAVRAGDATAEVVPSVAGLQVDWTATLDRAGAQPLSPFTRIASLFTHREIGVASTVDDAALAAAVDGLRPVTDREPVEGSIVFDGAVPRVVDPEDGQILDAAGAADALSADWASGSPVDLPVSSTPVSVTRDGIESALTDVAQPAVSGPITITGENNAIATLAPEQVGAVLSFAPNGDGGLMPSYDIDAATSILAPQLVGSERRPVDARFTLATGRPTVVAGVDGYTVQWPATLEALPDLLTTENRSAPAQYGTTPPALTTAAAEGLGVNEVIGEYTTGGFEYASGVNIGLAAQLINGALVLPGTTFSFNDYTGPRGTDRGFVESGIIDDGRPQRAVGGGISQLATTLYNAGYFAGMDDVEHTEHSYYISRYPEAREATIFEGAIDLKFRNPGTTGVLIDAVATSSNVTVRLWGTKTVDVESITGDRTLPTTPETIRLPRGEQCVASSGANGFTASDTRVVSDAASGAELSRNTRTVKYDPVPVVQCQ
ncbi:vanomycin resistance protein VanB [Rhodococcoides trifolii]|uniref:Vanomycin resistance protein VanB n=1 Tax=Rhodococcoides trifolii TaxID=908250 RepID=A0A917CNB4_9NOCA|nr:VanW family protein [Rhodococcus trifolii]GGF93673.1 vanomycin resistance protein VanB [Rhodococcus trifolii]